MWDGGACANWGSLLGLGLFTVAVLAGLYTKVGASSTTGHTGLSDQHTVNVLVICFEIGLLLITMRIAVWTIARHGIQI